MISPIGACHGCCFLVTQAKGYHCTKDTGTSCYGIIFKQHKINPTVFNAATAKEIALAAKQVKEDILTKIKIAAEQGKVELNVAGLNSDVLISLTKEPYNFIYYESHQVISWE